MPKFVYYFTEGNKDLKDLLGGEGANLAEMTNLGLPVPPGFTITTDACWHYLRHGSTPNGLGVYGDYLQNAQGEDVVAGIIATQLADQGLIYMDEALGIGVCGEHGGDPDSVHFFHEAGLDNVSCSPSRVPVARLEAGRAAVAGDGSDTR